MKETPNIISIKDLLYLEDMMNWNYVLYKKLNVFMECIEDEDIKDLLGKTKKMHKKHYKELLGILE